MREGIEGDGGREASAAFYRASRAEGARASRSIDGRR